MPGRGGHRLPERGGRGAGGGPPGRLRHGARVQGPARRLHAGARPPGGAVRGAPAGRGGRPGAGAGACGAGRAAGAPGAPRADLTMVFDARVTIGTVSFTQNTVELAGIFTDDAQQPVETVTGKGTTTVPWPAFIPSFPAAFTQAFTECEKSRDGAGKLRELVAARATGRKTAARPGAPADPAALASRVRGLPGRAWALGGGLHPHRP